jgi:Astacin (Peptidase family M12A)
MSLAAMSLAAVGVGCQANTQPLPRAPSATAYAGSSPPSGAVAPSTAMEAYAAPQAPRQLGSAFLFLPGSPTQQMVNFATVNGQAILEGDILLGPATTLPFRYGIPWQSNLESKSAVAVANRSYLWPGAEIPYAIDSTAAGKVAAIGWAVQVFDSTPIRLVPRTASDRDYVVFRELGGGCWSYLGRQGGPQDIDVTTCGAGNIAHELMHAAGFYHEQSRGDRDDYITIMWDEIAPEMRSNFDKRDARGQDIGAYDYDSIMHYPSTAGSRSGRATIVPRVANARIGQRDGLSALDRAALETLYPLSSRAPSASLPPASAPAPTLPAAPTLPFPTAQPSTSSPVPPASPTTIPSSSGASTSFTGAYSSARGNVSCNQGGLFVQCTYPSGSLFCAANGPELACTWNGAGSGRATFQRQASGVLAGSWGDGFSTNTRGPWDLVPLSTRSAAPASQPAVAPPRTAAPAPASATPASSASSAAAASLSGNYQSTRGNMSCVESGSAVSCNFQEGDGTSGRLDCAKSQNGLELACAWITYFPRPATGRAAFSRTLASERRLSGTWGTFLAASGAGTWNAQGL